MNTRTGLSTLGTSLHLVLLAAGLALATAPACGDDDGGGGDPADVPPDVQPDAADAADGGLPDVPPDLPPDAPTPDADATTPDAPAPDEGQGDAEPPDQSDGGGQDEFGFTIRTPTEHHIECPDAPPGFPDDSIDQLDMDWVCTFDHGALHGHVYVQATPTGCFVTMSATPTFGDARGWISLEGAVSELEGVVYDWGGNHHNDWIDFDYAGQTFRLYHSSFGWGWRQCQEMDCIQVVDPAGGQITEDGCTVDRTLPAVCRQVQADGTYEALIDTFEPCEGDPNHR